MTSHQRHISDFLAPPPVSRHPNWFVNSNSTSFSLHEILARKTNLRFQSNIAEFRFHSGAVCSDDQERNLSDPQDLLSLECRRDNDRKSYGGRDKTGNNDNETTTNGGGTRRRQRTLDDFLNMMTMAMPSNNAKNSNNHNNDHQENEDTEDAAPQSSDENDDEGNASPLSGFIGYVSAAEQYRNNNVMNHHTNTSDRKSNHNNNNHSKLPILKTFTKISNARGNGRDPIYFTRQLASSSSSSASSSLQHQHQQQRQPPLILSVAPSETLLYRLSTSTSITTPYLSKNTMIANGNMNRRNHRARNQHFYVNGHHDDEENELEDEDEDDNKIPNEPILSLDPKHQQLQQRNYNMMNPISNSSCYVRGTFLNSTTAILATDGGKIHCWDLERLLTTSSSRSSCVREISTSSSSSSSSSCHDSFYKSTTMAAPIVSVCTIPDNDNLIFTCSSGSSKIVQLFDLRVSSSSSSSCVSYWGATGQQVTNRDSSPLVTFGSSSSSLSNSRSTNNFSSTSPVAFVNPPQIRSGGFGNFGTLLMNNTGNNNNKSLGTSSSSSSTTGFFGIVGNNNNANKNNTTTSSSSSITASPVAMTVAQNSTGFPHVVVGDSHLMLRCWDLRKVSNNNNSSSTSIPSTTKPLYEVNFRETALAAIDHALPFASSPLQNQNQNQQPRQNVLGSIATMKSDPCHPFSVWINTTGGFCGRVEFCSSKTMAVPHAFYAEDSYRSGLQSGLPPLQMDVMTMGSSSNSRGGDAVIAACPRLFTNNVLVVATTDNGGDKSNTPNVQQAPQRKQNHIYFPHQMKFGFQDFFQNNNHHQTVGDHHDDVNSIPVACTFACGNTSEEMLVVEDQFRQLWVKDLVF